MTSYIDCFNEPIGSAIVHFEGTTKYLFTRYSHVLQDIECSVRTLKSPSVNDLEQLALDFDPVHPFFEGLWLNDEGVVEVCMGS